MLIYADHSVKLWNKIIYLLTSVGLIASIYCLYKQPDIFGLKLYWLLPFSYFIFHIFSKKIFEYNIGFSLILIETILCFRYVVTPIVVCFTDEPTKLLLYGSQENYSFGIFLMLYELFAVYICLRFIVPMLLYRKNIVIEKYKHKYKYLGILKIAIIVFWVFIVITTPKLQGYLFNFSVSNLDISKTIIYNEYMSDVSGLYKVFYKIGIIVIYVEAINAIKNRKSIHTPLKAILVIIISVLFISCTWNNGGNVSRWALLVGILMMIYILLEIFPQNKRIIIVSGIIAAIAILVFGTLMKTISFGLDLDVYGAVGKYISSDYLNEYFSGLFPVSNGVVSANNFSNYYKLDVLIKDLFSNLPYFTKILGLNAISSSEFYSIYTGHIELIMPTIAQSYYVFGMVGAPIYTCLSTIIAMYCQIEIRISNNSYIKLFLFNIMFWCSLCMAVNISVIQSNCWQFFIGIVLFRLDEKIRTRRNTTNIKKL